MNPDPVSPCLPALDLINRRAYQKPRVLRHFGRASGWLEPGEQRAFAFVADQVRGKPVLDIGVGGGRTAPLLRELSADYHGIDYAPRMVALARQRFPEFVFLQMDARELAFDDGRFGLVAFTFNGIDSIDLIGRKQVLSEAFRVLMPGGFFVFSALNLSQAAAMRHWPDWSVFNDVGFSAPRLVRACARLALGGVNWTRHLPLVHTSANLAVGQLPACNFALVTLYVSVPEQLQQLRAAGFTVAAMFGPDGSPVSVDCSGDSGALWHYYVAQKPN